MVAQPQIVGGTLSPAGALTSGAAQEVDLLSVSTVPASTTASPVWWKYTSPAGGVVNFDAMLSYEATGLRTILTPAITVSVFQAGDLVTPIASASSGVDPQQGAVARGSVAVALEAGITYYIALTGGPDAYRLLRVSDTGEVDPWQTLDASEYVQVISPGEGLSIEPDNFSGDYNDIVARSRKSISYGVAPAFFGPNPYGFPAAWDCAWQGHLIPCYMVVDGQLWNSPPEAGEWTGSGVCKFTSPPGPTGTSADLLTPAVNWSNSTDSTGHATGQHTSAGYRIDNALLLADDPGQSALGEYPTPPVGATLEIEDEDVPGAVLTLEIAATDDGTGDGAVAFRRFGTGFGVNSAGTWIVGVRPDGELLIDGYDGSVLWQPFSVEEGATSQVVGYTQYVEDGETPPAPSVGSSSLGEGREPELAFRLTWEPHRFRFVYPPDVPSVNSTVVRQWPRDDARGTSSAPRLWPRAKQLRLAGGYPGGGSQ